MQILSPNGVRVSVSDERGEQLLKQGYREVAADKAAAPAPAPAKRAPARKSSTDDK